jgi:hypothetical protein
VLPLQTRNQAWSPFDQMVSAPADSISPAVVDTMAELDDPTGKDSEHARPNRDEIDRRVTALVAEAAPAGA